MANSFVVLTGTSGVGLGQIAERLDLGEDWDVFTFEEALMDEGTASLAAQADWKMSELLNHPEPILAQLWQRAFAKISVDIRRSLEQKNVVLTMHTSWLSPNTTSIATGINPKALVESGLACERVINLIDDVYDVHARLDSPGRIYFSMGSPNFADEAEQLLTILEWREVEFRSSQLLGRSLGTQECYLFAVKHPLETLRRLICGGAPPVYLSHPISAIRRSGEWDANPLLSQIQTVASHLREHYVLFEPTTIDELRIDTARNSSNYRLTQRWPLAVTSTDQVAVRCAESPESRPLELFGPKPTEEQWSLIQAVANRIDRQINWRDRQLVSQSESLAVLRPYSKADGEVSGGVLAEIRLHADLATFKPLAKGVIFHPGSDERNRARRAVEAVVLQTFRHHSNDAPVDAELVSGFADELLAIVEEAKASGPAEPRAIALRVIERMHQLAPGTRIPNSLEGNRNLGYAEKERTARENETNLGRWLLDAFDGDGSAWDRDYRNRSTREFKVAPFVELTDDLDTTDLIASLQRCL